MNSILIINHNTGPDAYPEREVLIDFPDGTKLDYAVTAAVGAYDCNLRGQDLKDYIDEHRGKTIAKDWGIFYRGWIAPYRQNDRVYDAR